MLTTSSKALKTVNPWGVLICCNQEIRKSQDAKQFKNRREYREGSGAYQVGVCQ